MTGTALGVTEGSPPVVAQTNTRTHCERCEEELHPAKVHICEGNRRHHTLVTQSVSNEALSRALSNQKINWDCTCSPEMPCTGPRHTTAVNASLQSGDFRKIAEVLKQGMPPNSPLTDAIDEVAQIGEEMSKPKLTEREKYETMWKDERYRRVAPGEHIAQHFLEIARPRPGSHVIDFGCGTGRGTFMLGVWGKGLKVTMLDFASNCLDPPMQAIVDGTSTDYTFPGLEFHQQDLSQEIPYTAEFGFCTDVMEHIPPEQVDVVLTNILQAAQHVFFQISCVDDSCGELIGEKLHLSVHPPGWWLSKFAELKCQVHYFRDLKDSVLLYVTAWATGKEITDIGTLNIELAKIRENVKTNMGPPLISNHRPDLPPEYAKAAALVLKQSERICSELQAAGLPLSEDVIQGVEFDSTGCKIIYVSSHADHVVSEQVATETIELSKKDFCAALVESGARWKQVFPHQPNDEEVIILGGGPGLEDHFEDIKRLRSEGKKLVTLNGAYHWALEKGLSISATVVVDARPFNARFTHPVTDGTLYFIGSQCDPTVLEGLPHDRTWLWHTTAEDIRDLLEEMAPDSWFGVVGGCTVLLRAIPLLRMLGYSRFHLFGCDSCVQGITSAPKQGLLTREAHHHAYAQPENDENVIYPVIVGGRTFHCTAWQIAQAQNFIDMIRVMGDLFELQVYGDGLLAWILQHGYELDLEAEKTTPLERQRAAQL